MSTFYRIEPAVSGELGLASELDYSTPPPYAVTKLVYEFSVWLGDDLLTADLCYIVTERLRDALIEFGGSGYSFADMEISTTEDFDEMNPGLTLPRFYWMKIHGIPGVDDAGIVPLRGLVVSDRLLGVFRGTEFNHCTVRRKPYRATKDL